MAKQRFTIDELLEHTFGTNWREESERIKVMDKYGIENYEDFDEDEQHHLMALNRRRKELANIKTARASWDQQKKEELAALEWVFTVLNEISEDEDEEEVD